MGKTKVFLRRKTFDALEYLRGQKLIAAATKIQTAGRMFPIKLQYEYTLWCTVQIQLYLDVICTFSEIETFVNIVTSTSIEQLHKERIEVILQTYDNIKLFLSWQCSA